MVFLWSYSFVLVDIAVEFVSPIALALDRFVIASIAFIILDICLRLKKKVSHPLELGNNTTRKISNKEWIYLVFASICGISLFFYSQYTAIEFIGPSLPALFVCLLAPILITILALVFFKEKITKLKLIGFLIATFGGFLLITGGSINTLNLDNPQFFLGYIFALLTPVLWAIYSTLIKKVSQNQSNLKILKFMAYLGTIELFFFALITDTLRSFLLNFFNIIVLISGVYLGIGCYIIGYFIWQKSQKELESSKGASFLYLEPFLTLVLSFLLNRSEIIVLGNLIGGLIVLAALLIINYN